MAVGKELPLSSGGTIDTVTTVSTVSSITDGYIKPKGVYLASAPTLADGQTQVMRLDVSANQTVAEQFAPGAEDNTNGVFQTVVKPLAVSTYAPSLSASLGSSNSLSVKGSAGNIFSIYASNMSTAVRYLQIHNKATAATTGNVPIASFLLSASGPTADGYESSGYGLVLGSDYFTPSGLHCSTGIAVAISTNQFVFNDPGSAFNYMLSVLYK